MTTLARYPASLLAASAWRDGGVTARRSGDMEPGPSSSLLSAANVATTPITNEGVRPNRKRPRAPQAQLLAPPPQPTVEQTLRHFSLKVCQVVQSLGETTYNEVADQLVAEIVGDKCEANSQSEERNVRRCVTPGPHPRLRRAHLRHAAWQTSPCCA